MSREHILETALEVFRENGYERTTVRTIAERAGVPISTLYAHIGSKEELFLGLVAPVIERARVEMDEILASDLPPREKLRRAITRSATAFDGHYPELFIYLRDFYPVLERADPQSRRDYEQQWVDLLRLGMDEGALRDDLDPKMLAYGILGMVNWMHQWYRPGGRFSAAEIGEQFASAIVDGVAAAPGRG
jgi:TetR/AcrR family transcriptional regulator, cholesterol catabolism regulator